QRTWSLFGWPHARLDRVSNLVVFGCRHRGDQQRRRLAGPRNWGGGGRTGHDHGNAERNQRHRAVDGYGRVAAVDWSLAEFGVGSSWTDPAVLGERSLFRRWQQ